MITTLRIDDRNPATASIEIMNTNITPSRVFFAEMPYWIALSVLQNRIVNSLHRDDLSSGAPSSLRFVPTNVADYRLATTQTEIVTATRIAASERDIQRVTSGGIRTVTMALPPHWWIQRMNIHTGIRTGDALLVLELPDATIMAWPFGNVYGPTGRICWGHNTVPTDGNARELDSLFFRTPFNMDLVAHSWGADFSGHTTGVSIEQFMTGIIPTLTRRPSGTTQTPTPQAAAPTGEANVTATVTFTT